MKIDINSKVNIDSKTKLYAVIGDPIAHSLSPIFQNYFIKQRDMNAIYIPLRITADTLGGSLDVLRNNFMGFNVTIPHKENIMRYLDRIDPPAAEYGAVNTVKVVGDKLIGYNTDGIGFTRSIGDVDINLKRKRVLLLGAGGAARVIASEVIKSGGNLTIANRNTDRGESLKRELQKFYDVDIDAAGLEDISTSFDAVINSTSVGMYPDTDELPINPDVLRDAELVYDVIYNPPKTELLRFGKKFGAGTANGLPMLIYQGLKSFEIWTEEKATHSEEEEIYKMLKSKI